MLSDFPCPDNAVDTLTSLKEMLQWELIVKRVVKSVRRVDIHLWGCLLMSMCIWQELISGCGPPLLFSKSACMYAGQASYG